MMAVQLSQQTAVKGFLAAPDPLGSFHELCKGASTPTSSYVSTYLGCFSIEQIAD